MSSSTGIIFKNETPLVENGFPLGSEYYPYYPTTGYTTGVTGVPTGLTTGVTGVTCVPTGLTTGVTGVTCVPTGVTGVCGMPTGLTTGVTGVCGMPTGLTCGWTGVPTGMTTGMTGQYGVVGENVVCEPTMFKYVVDVLNTVEDSYLTGHQIDGRILYPTTGYLYLVWKSLAKLNGYPTVEQMPVMFENVEIHRATILAIKQQIPTKQIEFCVRIVPTTGLFELVEGENVIVTGRVCVHESKLENVKTLVQQHITYLTERKRVAALLEQEQIYREFKMRGYEYNGEFQPILRADLEGTCGELVFTGKWIPFLDSMIQMNTLRCQKSGLLLPTRIRSIKIDPFAHYHAQKMVSKMIKSWSTPVGLGMGLVERQQPFVLPVVCDPVTLKTVCGGVEIVGLQSTYTGIQSFVPTTTQTTTCTSTTTTAEGTGICHPITFVPYHEKHFDEEYVVVEKQLVGEQPQITCVEPTMRQSREFLEFYLNECRRYISHILKRCEQPTVVFPVIVPSTIPRTLEQQLEGLKITCGQQQQYFQQQYPEIYSTPYGKMLEGGRLLQLLIQVANVECHEGQYLYKIQKIFNEKFAYLKALEEDCVLNQINNRSYYLKNIMDTVLENTHHIFYGQQYPTMPTVVVDQQQPRLRVLEISPSVGQFFGAKVNNLMKLYPNRLGHIDYHYVPSMVGVQQPTTVVTEEYIMELNKQLPYQIKKVDWTFGLKNGQLIHEVPSYLREYDLVILNGGLSSLLPYVEGEYELKKFLQTVVMEKIMKPQGFLFVHEYTNQFELLNQLNHLEQSIVMCQPTTVYQSVRGRFPYQKYQTEMQWRQMIEECGLYPVSVKSDVELSTMFLYRRPVSFTTTVNNGVVVCCEEKVFLDECETIQHFVKKVRVLCGEKQVERCWIVSEKKPTVEIVTVINGLRREMGGEKIRCLFVSDRQPVNIFGQRYVVPAIQELIQTPTTTVVVPTQWTELFGLIRKGDLIMNYIRQGQLGSFRPIRPYHFTPYTTQYPTLYQVGYPVLGQYPVVGGRYPYVNGQYPVVGGRYPVACGQYPVVKTQCPVVCGQYPVVCHEHQVMCGQYPVVSGQTVVGYEGMYKQTVGLTTPITFNPYHTYIVTCGVTSFGLELVEWMMEHGARRVVLTTKYGVRTGYQARKLRILKDEFNAQIQVVQCDVKEEVECMQLIKEAVQMSVEGKIGGVFHLGSFVEEELLCQQQYPVTHFTEMLKKITECRMQGAYNLEKLTRAEGIMEETGLFVVFSPVFNQTTTLAEKICETRRRFGRHGLAVHFGVNTDNGLLVESMFGCENVEQWQTMVPVSRVYHCLRVLETLLCKTTVEPTVFVPVEKYWNFEQYHQYQQMVQYKTLVELICTVLGKEWTKLCNYEQTVTLGELGLDSVVALELKQLFEQFYNFPLAIRDIHQLTLEKIRHIESRYPQGIYELHYPRPSTFLPRLRSVIRKNYF